MKRKLVKLGKNCLMSAIPMKWIKQQNLGKGDFLNFEEVENYLLLSAKPLPKEKELKIKIKNSNKVSIMRTLQTIYDSGVNKLIINYESNSILKIIIYTVNWLDSWKITSQDKGECIIESIKENEFDFDNYFRRLFLNVVELTKLCSDFFSGKKEAYDEIKLTYELTYRGAMEIKRKINTNHLPLEYKYYYFIAIQIEEIADLYEFLIRNFENKNPPKDLLKYNQKLEDLISKAYGNFYKFDLENYITNDPELVWKFFETDKYPKYIYYLRAISERIKNISKYTIGIKISNQNPS